jgi:hypothetical protein
MNDRLAAATGHSHPYAFLMQTSQGPSHRQHVIRHHTSNADLFDLPSAPPEPECRVRAATEDDMAPVTSIYREFVEKSTATFELVALDEIEMSHRRQAVLDADLPYLVAELEGSPSATATRRSSVPAKATASPWKIRSMYAGTVSAMDWEGRC